MSGCAATPVVANKACSGRCRGGSCNAPPRVWVLAACEGMISLFEKSQEGVLAPVLQVENGIFASLEAFQKSIDKAEHAHEFDQLVIIGSGNDIAWIHASLPILATRRIAAEIEYPLLPAWFRQPLPLSSLTHALEGVFAHS